MTAVESIMFRIIDYADMYLFDPAGKWTYIRPYEDDCGPYFFKAE